MQIAEGLNWSHIYWVRGALPKGYLHKNAVSDPPCSGWQLAFVLPGETVSTIFCPYSLEAHTVNNDCSELALAQEPGEPFRQDHVAEMMRQKWDQFQELGFLLDYDVCALVFKRLGLPVPAQIMTGGGEDTRKKGGKEVDSRLLKPVKANSKRGRFLKWFLDAGGSRSIRETMAELSMTRSNALSYLFLLRKDHGLGYELTGDTATVMLPEGCENPFDVPAPEPVEDDEDDDSWLD